MEILAQNFVLPIEFERRLIRQICLIFQLNCKQINVTSLFRGLELSSEIRKTIRRIPRAAVGRGESPFSSFKHPIMGVKWMIKLLIN